MWYTHGRFFWIYTRIASWIYIHPYNTDIHTCNVTVILVCKTSARRLRFWLMLSPLMSLKHVETKVSKARSPPLHWARPPADGSPHQSRAPSLGDPVLALAPRDPAEPRPRAAARRGTLAPPIPPPGARPPRPPMAGVIRISRRSCECRDSWQTGLKHDDCVVKSVGSYRLLKFPFLQLLTLTNACAQGYWKGWTLQLPLLATTARRCLSINICYGATKIEINCPDYRKCQIICSPNQLLVRH